MKKEWKDFVKDQENKMIETKRKWRNIRKQQREGIKNPYDHFLHNLPNNLQNITNKNSK